MRVATDVGGTFTDLVYYDVDPATGMVAGIRTAKTDTTPPNFEEGVLQVLAKAGISIRDMTFFAHGTTTVINALSERKGARVGLITTRGFRDVLEIARGDRPDFFNLMYRKPPPFVPRFLRQEVTERMSYQGEVRVPLIVAELAPIVEQFRKEQVDAIAVCFLHSYANPQHETAAVAEVRRLWPGISIIASNEVIREWREYERTNTTVLAAYVKPVAERYLDRLHERLTAGGYAGRTYVMQSNGGIGTLEAARSCPITMVESGPASGMLAAAALGKLIGRPNVIALDIGGTTAKCALIENGTAAITTRYFIEKNALSAGYPILTPVVDLVEIGNGGGSIAWVDQDGKLFVGPRSAGASPGPVAYGRGGTQPTTTDANLLTRRINPDYFFGGEIEADMHAVREAFATLGAQLGLTPEEAARGVIRIANNNMINALKLVSLNRGHDPRDFTLIAFGGGGALHATSLAAELNIPEVLIPVNSSVFSAWGMLMSDLRRDYVQTRVMDVNAENARAIRAEFRALEARALQDFAADGVEQEAVEFIRAVEMRYRNQEHSVKIELAGEVVDRVDVDAIGALFHERYEREYTYSLASPIEIVSFHLTAHGRIERPPIARVARSGATLEQAMKGRRVVDFAEVGLQEALILERAQLEPGMTATGPAIIEEPATTTLVLPGQRLTVDDYGNLVIRV